MSDWVDVVRGANPVPRPQPFEVDVRRRITAAIVEDDSTGSPRARAAAPERVPAGACACKRICPESTVGKKSLPTR